MLENRVLSIQQTLCRFDVDINVDPILRRRVAQFVDAIGQEPFMNKVERFLGRRNEIVDILDCKVLPKSRVIRIGN